MGNGVKRHRWRVGARQFVINDLSLNNTYAITLSAENRGLSIYNNVTSYLGELKNYSIIDSSAILNAMEVKNNYFERQGSTNFMVYSDSALLVLVSAKTITTVLAASTFNVNNITMQSI